MPVLYRANFGDGTYTKGWPDLRDALLAVWGRSAIVQYRSFIERRTLAGNWETFRPSRASQNGPAIVEQR